MIRVIAFALLLLFECIRFGCGDCNIRYLYAYFFIYLLAFLKETLLKQSSIV